MTKQRMLRVERRQQKRFKAEEGAYAALVNGVSKLGQIKDISIVGLSFRYIDCDDRPSNDCELKIILGSRGLYLDHVPIEMVADFEIDSEFVFSSVRMRQVGLKFGELSYHQRDRLNYFIQNHTVGEA